MTETTDIAALREAALKATAGEWCTDSQNSVIADAGMNANYYVAACSGPDSQINASFIALANPAAIIAILDQLEAERQQREAAEAELAALKAKLANPVVPPPVEITQGSCIACGKQHPTGMPCPMPHVTSVKG